MNNKRTKYDFLMRKLRKLFSTNELFISENSNVKNETKPNITKPYLLNNNNNNSNKKYTKVKMCKNLSKRRIRNKI